MIRPFYLNIIFSVLGVIVVAAIGAIPVVSSSPRFEEVADFIFRWEIGYGVLVLVILVLPIGVWSYILNAQLYQSKDENHQLKMENKNLELRLQEEHTKNRYDIVTKIPNRTVWEEHVPLYCAKSSPNRHHQLIMLDLVDFSSVNKIYGHFIGDEVLETIAQDLYGTVRRAESVYKDSAKDVYRSYERGDEFLFIVEGFQWDAIGLLNRLHERAKILEEQIERNCQKVNPDLESVYCFRFRAGIAPLGSQDSPKDAFERIAGALQKAFVREKAEGIRVYWSPETKDLSEINPKYLPIYEKAIRYFSN